MRRAALALLAPLAAGLALAGDAGALARRPAPTLEDFPTGQVSVHTTGGERRFRVWIADTHERRSQGLMWVESMAADEGMLFLFEEPQFASFWMKDTPMSLDIVFIAPDGSVTNIAPATEPYSERPIPSSAPVLSVLELRAGTARAIGLQVGDRVELRGNTHRARD